MFQQALKIVFQDLSIKTNWGGGESIYSYLKKQISSFALSDTAEIPNTIFIYCKAVEVNQKSIHRYIWIIPYIPTSASATLAQNTELRGKPRYKSH